MTIARLALLAAALACAAPSPAAQPGQARIVEGFADLAGLTLLSPVVLRATIVDADKLGRKAAPGVPPGRVRMLVEAKIDSVFLAPDAVPARIRYLWEGPLDARGKAPKLKGAPVLLFLRPSGRAGAYQLAHAEGQVAATPAAVAAVRRAAEQSRSAELRGLRVTGVGNAFHVRGSVPGESESQIFVETADGRPFSIVVLSRPGEGRTYSVSTGDMIDDSAKPVQRDTLLWYELACRLPKSLPSTAAGQLSEEDRRAVEDDYLYMLGALGSCERTLG